MTHIALYLVGSVVALLALDGVPPATQQVSSIAAALKSNPPLTNNVNRAAKGDRLMVMRRPMKPAPDVAREPTAGDGHMPMGCESAFSPVVSPSLAHVVGRCMVENESPRHYAELVR